MNIISVIPLTRSKVAAQLSYFTSTDVPIGAIVTVPLRSKSIHAIVTESKPAEDQKSSIKRASFMIRKLNKVKTTMFFPSEFIETCTKLSDHYATTIGSVIYSIISNEILENVGKIHAPLSRQDSLKLQTKISSDNSSLKNCTYAIQGDDTDRIGSWRSMIRQEFAQKKSVAMYAPTVEEAKNLFDGLEKGIEGYIFLLHSGMTTKKIMEIWQKISNTDHPVMVIATSQFSLLPRGDIDVVIIERENSRDWISKRTPYIDGRHALEVLSRMKGQTVYLADCLLRTETLYRVHNHDVVEGSPFKWRSISTARDQVVDMRQTRRPSPSIETDSSTPFPNGASTALTRFKVISTQLENLINENIATNTHLFIYNTRRGFSPSTICGDCQSVVTCKQCSTPVVLHTSKESGRNFFMCHKCGERRSADETCIFCGSWKLTTLGIGIDRVAEEIHNLFPGTDVFQIDTDTTKTTKQIEDAMAKFRERPGSILLGTEMTLPYIRDKIDHVAITSVDPLFSLPDFRIQEKLMHTITRLRAIATRSILLQTRLPAEKLFDYAMKGNLSDFYRSTVEERETFRYPPLSTLIKITIEGKKEMIADDMSKIQEALNPYQVDIFPAFTSTIKGASVIHGLIKVDTNSWPDPDLVQRLRALPPSVSVRVGPESLL
ncbi:MAG: hypothetical protein WCP09_04120 [Candidatus Taylorbacteria bacterium]